MDFVKLKRNMLDIIKEEQIKLGFQTETIHLFYPLQSLNRFLGTDFDSAGMLEALKHFQKELEPELGAVDVSVKGERFCFTFPPQVAEYVHTHSPQSGFLYDFIETISRHGVKIDQVLEIFHRYSPKVHIEKVNNGEFDYLVYFEDGEPDEYRYCLTDEGCHIIYHRFTEADYKDLFPQ